MDNKSAASSATDGATVSAPDIGENGMWVFGYGSLLWKVDFPYETKLTGYIRGFVRRFYQSSIDHRGVPEKPGRVATLLEAGRHDSVWGIAYKIRSEDIEDVVKHLDFRERNGYNRHTVKFYPRRKEVAPFSLTVYVATPQNSQFLGPATYKIMGTQIYEATGPSGTNKEYLYNVCQAIRDIAPEVIDDHLDFLEKIVLKLDNDFDHCPTYSWNDEIEDFLLS